MAFRNSVKATLLELEEPCADEPRTIIDVLAPLAQRPVEKPVAQEPVEKPAAQRPMEKPATPRQVDSSAKPAPAPQAKPPAEAFLAATWHARAEELCAMADTLPSKASWSLISKIAGLYDELARDAGWTESETPVVEPLRLEEAAPAMDDAPLLEEDPPALALLAEPLPPDRAAFARRPLPLGRRFPRRRA